MSRYGEVSPGEEGVEAPEVVVAHQAEADEPAADHTVFVDRSALDDATVLVDDATSVVNRAGAASMAEDATPVVTRVDRVETAPSEEPAAIDDATYVVNRASTEAAPDDATIVSMRPGAEPADDSGAASAAPQASASVPSASFADYMRAGSAATGTGTGTAGLDPDRRIAQVPGRLPWEIAPTAESGVHQGLPVVYGPRGPVDAETGGQLDEVHRQIGPAPAATFVPVREGREALASTRRRERRSRTVTLVAYGAVGVVAVLGLWGIAVLAFG